MRRKVNASLFAVIAFGVLFAQPAPERLAQANQALESGEADQALRLLDALPSSAEAHNLRCRVQFSLRHWDAAIDQCRQAVASEPRNSDFHMWLGRALGEKASHASFLSAFSLGNQVRTEFDEAVRLNPQSALALADLGEFDYEAPGILGGGSDKAEAIAAQLEKVDAARAYELRGRIAEKRHDFAAAERELKQAISASRHPAFQWMILASFYTRHNRWTDMDAAVANGLSALHEDAAANVARFNAASMLQRCNRNLPLAARLFRDYLAGSPKTDEAPTFAVYTKLAQIEAGMGNIADAKRDRVAALGLAHDYKPALDLKF